METGDLVGTLRWVLDRIVTEAAALENALELPSRRYVTVGGAVFDCEQVVVSGMSINTGLASPTGDSLQLITSGCAVAWSAQIEAAIVFCANEKMGGTRGEQAPLVSGIEADAEKMSKCSAVLANVAEKMPDTFGPVSCNIQLGQPQGGLIAAVATIGSNLWLPT